MKIRNILLALTLAITVAFGAGCASPTANMTPEQAAKFTVNSTKIKAGFKAAVASGALVAMEKNPNAIAYCAKVQKSICALQAAGVFSPASISAALNAAEVKELETLEAIAARNLIVALYEVYYADKDQADIAPDSFAAGLLEVLCEGLNQAVGDAIVLRAIRSN